MPLEADPRAGNRRASAREFQIGAGPEAAKPERRTSLKDFVLTGGDAEDPTTDGQEQKQTQKLPSAASNFYTFYSDRELSTAEARAELRKEEIEVFSAEGTIAGSVYG